MHTGILLGLGVGLFFKIQRVAVVGLTAQRIIRMDSNFSPIKIKEFVF
jgi:hypothetical protein